MTHECVACEFATHSVLAILEHLESEEHDEVCEELEELGWEVCWDCGARTTEGNMDTHLAGRKYQQRMDLCSCDLCDVQDVSFKHMIEHLRGRRHQAALNAKAAAKAAKPPPAPPAVAAPKPEALSMVTVRAALEEVCASAVSDVKRFLCCPITHVVMQDPVMAADGYTYERVAIERVLASAKPPACARSPVTGAPLPSRQLQTNRLALDIVRHLGLPAASSTAAAAAGKK